MENNIINPEHCELLLDFGLQPVSNRFISNQKRKAPKFPLELKICTENGLIYLGRPFPVEELKPRYNWLTCFEPEDHLDELVNRITQLPGINKNSVFGAYSFKDDSTLQRLSEGGYNNNWRINPEKDLGINDNCSSIETYQSLFTVSKADKISKNYGPADVLIIRHVVEHSYNLTLFIEATKKLVKPNGYIVWELPDCEKALSNGDCTTIWEEHIYYFTRFTFREVLRGAGFKILYYDSTYYPLENSIIAIVQKNNINNEPLKTVDQLKIVQEISRAYKFAEKIIVRKDSIREQLIKIKKKYGPIALFGAGHLAVAFLSIMDISDLISFVIDDNKNKQGMMMPIGNLTIAGSEILRSEKIGVCLLSLNPQNHNIIIKNNKEFSATGGVFLSIFPKGDLCIEKFL